MSVPKYASDFPYGYLVKDYTDPDTGLRVIVRAGTVSFCAYVGVQTGHVLAELDDLEFDCHQGITYREWGSKETGFPEGWFWWGWDYAHFCDKTEFSLEDLPPESQKRVQELKSALEEALEDMLGMDLSNIPKRKTKRWTADEVFQDALEVLLELKTALSHSQQYSSLLTASF